MRKPVLCIFGLVVAVLVALGLVVLFSASGANGLRLHNDTYFFMKRQCVYLVAGIVVAAIVAWFDYHEWRRHEILAWLFFSLVCVLLLAVFAFPEINGSRRWLPLKFFSIQPSELAKLSLVILLSVRLDRVGWRVELFKQGAFHSILLIAIVASLVIAEPDFGATMVIVILVKEILYL